MNKEKLRIYWRRYRKAHPGLGKKYNAKKREHAREKAESIKKEVLSHYGPGSLQCSFPGCTVSDVDMLTLDHVDNDGSTDRKVNGKGSDRTYMRLKKNKFPEGFQTLCWNHQWKKEILRRRLARIPSRDANNYTWNNTRS